MGEAVQQRFASQHPLPLPSHKTDIQSRLPTPVDALKSAAIYFPSSVWIQMGCFSIRQPAGLHRCLCRRQSSTLLHSGFHLDLHRCMETLRQVTQKLTFGTQKLSGYQRQTGKGSLLYFCSSHLFPRLSDWVFHFISFCLLVGHGGAWHFHTVPWVSPPCTWRLRWEATP